MSSIAENLDKIRERIARAADKAGQDPDRVRLVTVSKTFAADRVREAAQAGARVFGENYVQEANWPTWDWNGTLSAASRPTRPRRRSRATP